MISFPAFDPAFLSVAVICVIVIGISKSGLGGGLGQLTVPVLAMFVTPLEAVAIMLPVLCVCDVFNLWKYRRDFHKRNLLILLPTAVIGIAIGGLTFKYVDDNVIRLLLGVLSLIFALSYFRASKPVDAQGRSATIFGMCCGMLSGFTSTVAHAGGGPVKMFLLPQRLEKKVFVATQVFFFFAVNQLKIWPYLWLGQFTPQSLGTSLILLPVVPIGMLIGYQMVERISPETFYRIVYGVLFLAGIKLIYDGLSGLGVI